LFYVYLVVELSIRILEGISLILVQRASIYVLLALNNINIHFKTESAKILMSDEQESFHKDYDSADQRITQQHQQEPANPAVPPPAALPKVVSLHNQEVIDLSKQEGEKVIELSANGRYAKVLVASKLQS
jgi:hypothetical protein